MSYSYNRQREEIFTPEGVKTLIRVYDTVLKQPKLFYAEDGLEGATGDSWTQLACLDFLVEIGRLQFINYDYPSGQKRIYAKVS